MKKFIYIFFVMFLVSCGSNKNAGISTDTSKDISNSKVTVQSVLSGMENGTYKEGELLVKFKSDVVKTSSLKTHQSVGSSVIRSFSVVPNLEHVKLPESISVKDAVIKYMSDPNVEYAEPNYIKHIDSTIPNDTYFLNQQWGLYNQGQYANGIIGADINAPGAWDISRGNFITVAVIDSGIDYNHQDLGGNIWSNPNETNCVDGIDNDADGYTDDCNGWNFVDNNNDPMDDLGHGSHVAGIIGAVTNNNFGISGVMWNVRIMPLKFGDAYGNGWSVATETAAIQYAISKGAKVINASFGSGAYSNTEYDAISAANIAKVLFIASAGNGGDDGFGDNNDITPHYPSSYNLPNIISVAASDQNDRRAVFSNYGLNTVHVAAPGVYILSTVPQGSSFAMCTGSPFAGYDFCDGTSMAAPHVVGLTGLLYGYYTNFDYSQIRSTILRYVDVLPDLNGWIMTGGRVDAYLAVSSLLTPDNLTATALSSSEISISWADNATGEDGYKIERKLTGGSFIEIARIGYNINSFTDSGLDPTTSYTYRVRAYNNIGESPAYSNEASATTLAVYVPVETHHDSGGCSIGMRQNMPTAMADIAVILIPLIFIAVMRRRRQ